MKRQQKKGNVSLDIINFGTFAAKTKPKRGGPCFEKVKLCVLCSNPHNNWWGFSMWLLGLIQWVTCSETNMTFKSRLYPGLTGKRPSAPAAVEAGLRSFLIRASSNPPSDLNLESRLVNNGQHLSKVGVVRRVRGKRALTNKDASPLNVTNP